MLTRSCQAIAMHLRPSRQVPCATATFAAAGLCFDNSCEKVLVKTSLKSVVPFVAPVRGKADGPGCCGSVLGGVLSLPHTGHCVLRLEGDSSGRTPGLVVKLDVFGTFNEASNVGASGGATMTKDRFLRFPGMGYPKALLIRRIHSDSKAIGRSGCSDLSGSTRFVSPFGCFPLASSRVL